MKKASIEASVQFADALRSKLECCGNASAEERSKKPFIDDLPANVQSATQSSWCQDHDAHFFGIFQYADTLLKQTGQVSSSVAALVRRDCFWGGRRTTPMVASEAKQRATSPRNINNITNPWKERSFLKQESYASDYKTQQSKYCCACSAKVLHVETCLYTFRLGELAQKKS